MRPSELGGGMTSMGSSVRRINLVQVGVGLIGCTTIEQVLDHRARWQRDLGLDVVYRGLIDFDGAVACDDPDGYSEKTLRGVVEARKARQGVAEFAPALGLTPRQGGEALEI